MVSAPPPSSPPRRKPPPSAWLGADGLNAEASLFAAAGQARRRGETLNSVDLACFVRDAVLLEGGNVRDLAPDINELSLPSSWIPGL